MKKLTFILIVFISSSLKAETGAYEDFKRANRAYEDGNFAGAISAYQDILKTGINDPSVYYNLGNAFFREKNMGMSILYYERAQALKPRDEDIRFNISHARSFIADEEIESGWLSGILSSVFNSLTLNELCIFACLSYFMLSFILTILLIMKKRLLGWLSGPAAILFLFSATWLVSRIYLEENREEAIIISAATAYSGPGQDYQENFMLPEGQKILLLNRRGGWSEIGIESRGLKGWIQSSSLEKI